MSEIRISPDGPSTRYRALENPDANSATVKPAGTLRLAPLGCGVIRAALEAEGV